LTWSWLTSVKVYHVREMSVKENSKRSKRGEPASPCPELDAWLAGGEERSRRALAEGRLGRRRRLRRVLVERYGGVGIPKEVRKTAEGVMVGLMLQIWWVSPNNYLWPKTVDGRDLTRDFLDATGRTTVTPMLMWVIGQKEEVIDLIMAMKV